MNKDIKEGLLAIYKKARPLITKALAEVDKEVQKASPPTSLNREPSNEEVTEACLNYRHDFGLMDKEAQLKFRNEAVYWLIAWRKVFDK